ncbi:protein of unknown function [Pararobbsia alpina]|uniref:transcriptional regulator n=1 Tax=Pararobbsia alpina TaxID=621374 RepID=UPI0039A49515
MNTAISRAVEHFGSMAEMARRLELSSYTVIQQWKLAGRVPPEHCPKIERMLDGAVRCEELNDRVDWAYVRSTQPAGQTSA